MQLFPWFSRSADGVRADQRRRLPDQRVTDSRPCLLLSSPSVLGSWVQHRRSCRSSSHWQLSLASLGDAGLSFLCSQQFQPAGALFSSSSSVPVVSCFSVSALLSQACSNCRSLPPTAAYVYFYSISAVCQHSCFLRWRTSLRHLSWFIGGIILPATLSTTISASLTAAPTLLQRYAVGLPCCFFVIVINCTCFEGV